MFDHLRATPKIETGCWIVDILWILRKTQPPDNADGLGQWINLHIFFWTSNSFRRGYFPNWLVSGFDSPILGIECVVQKKDANVDAALRYVRDSSATI